MSNKEKKKASSKALNKKNHFQVLTFLNDLDANLKIQVKSLMYKEQMIKNAVFDGTLYNGSLDVRRLSTDQLSGSRLFAKGKISDLSMMKNSRNNQN